MKRYNRAKTHEEKMAALNFAIVCANAGTILGLLTMVLALTGLVWWPTTILAAGLVAFAWWWGRD